MTTTMTPMDTNKDVESVKEAAIAFYDQEKTLSPSDRKQLYVFFEQQCRRMLLGFTTGVVIGASIPFILRTKKSMVQPALPIVGAVLGGSIVPGLVNHKIYSMQVEDFKQKFGEHSPICETIKNTPDPINKAVFWSTYFKKSSSDPNFRMRDPRTITGTKFFTIDDTPRVASYGKQDQYKGGEEAQTVNQNQLTGWDKIRNQRASNSQKTTEYNDVDDVYQQRRNTQYNAGSTTAYTEDDDPFEQHGEDRRKAFSIITDNDQLISAPGASGSSWDKIRRGQK